MVCSVRVAGPDQNAEDHRVRAVLSHECIQQDHWHDKSHQDGQNDLDDAARPRLVRRGVCGPAARCTVSGRPSRPVTRSKSACIMSSTKVARVRLYPGHSSAVRFSISSVFRGP